MSESTSLQLEGESIIQKLASSFPEAEQKAITRDVFLATQMKTTGVGDKKRKLNIYESFTYVMACQSLGLNPALNHLLFLEDQVYITLAGHLHNAHASGTLRGLTTTLIGKEDTEFIKKGWNGAADTKVKTKQFRYECVIKKLINGDIAEFRAEGVADAGNVTGGANASELKLEQMAEARAMRRCLSRAFPVGLSSFEDVQETQSYESQAQTTIASPQNAPTTELGMEIANAGSLEELEALKPKIQASKDGNMIKAYAQRAKDLKSEDKGIGKDIIEGIKQTEEALSKKKKEEMDARDTAHDFDQEMRSDADEEKKIAELQEELEENQQ